MSPYRKHLRVAGLVFGLVIQASSHLSAQGGQQARRSASMTPSDAAPAAQPALEPARSILRHLVGRWRVEIRFAGNFDGAPDASATRIVDTLFDDLRLQWTEVENDTHLSSQGVLGFDTRTGRFYSTAMHSGGAGAEFLTGTMNLLEPVVTFAPMAPTAGQQASESFKWTMVDPDHFIWAPLDRGWRAVLTREQ
ncbi:MAG TPA: DUF1579 family protein [Gemmatimonadales bacterium]|jgi:hypothetical protein